MKRKQLSFIALVLLSLGCMAAPVDTDASRRAASNFWNTHRPVEVKAVAPEQMQMVPVASLPMLHIWAVGGEGFVIMSASDLVEPVLAYSFNSSAVRGPNAEVMFWLGMYNDQIAAAEASGVENGVATAQWEGLLNTPVPPTPVSLVVVPQLMHTTWDQGSPYNDLCPYDSAFQSRTVVGCVATAMAQIMKYWNHPSTGTGSRSYVHHAWGAGVSYGLQEANFGQTTYRWDLMPTFLTQLVTDPLPVRAVATLSYHCGVAVDMMYGPSATGGSAAYSSCGYWASACAENAFRDYFKYSPDLYHLQRNNDEGAIISDSLWCDLIDSNLAHGAPMYYSGSDSTGGHAFVLDGSDEQGRYHFNWGWGGSFDGFYSINDIAPHYGGVGGNTTYTFNRSQGAIFGIVPLEEHFDSVTIDDTICRNELVYRFHEYEFPVADTVYTAIHLDTVFTINLHVISIRRLYVNPNGGSGSNYDMAFCPTEGIDAPVCNFTRNNHVFTGWAFSRNNYDTLYQPGDHLAIRTSKTIYAIWHDTTATEPEDTVGISNVEGREMLVSPNPAHDRITLTLPDDGEADLSIIDAWGRVIVQRKVVGPKTEISLKALPAGTYTATVKTTDDIYKQRIIKQ